MKPTSLLALAVAAARARESAREGRLFDDPLAATLAGPEGIAWLDAIDRALPPPPGHGPSPLAVRTRFFDDFLQAAVDSPTARQVVMVGAGMDMRAHRLPWPADLTIFELDDEALIGRKARLLDECAAKPRCNRIAIAVDLQHAWEQPLIDAGFDRTRPSVWLIEGLLAYLDEAGVHRLLQPIASLAAPASMLGADLPGAHALRHPQLAPLIALLAERGAAWRFGVETPETLFSLYGWTAAVLETQAAARRYGVAAPASAPRSMRGVARSFLVTAHRRSSA